MNPLLISRYTATTCLGRGLAPLRDALVAGRSGLKPCDFETVELDTWIGEVEGADDERLPPRLREFDCRNNRLAQIGLNQDGFADAVRAAAGRYGAGRIGVFLGTSTAGILETELAYRRRDAASGAAQAAFYASGAPLMLTPGRAARLHLMLAGAGACGADRQMRVRLFHTPRRGRI